MPSRGIVVVAGLACACASRPNLPPKVTHVDALEPDSDMVGIMDVADDLAPMNVGALVHVDRVREHPSAWNVVRLAGWGKLLAAAELDPVFDVDRFFVAAEGVVSCRPILVFRHRLDKARVAQAFETLLEKSRVAGERIAGLGFPAIGVTLFKRPIVVLAPQSDHLVMMPRDLLPHARKFEKARGLPPPVGAEAWIGWSNQWGWPPFPGALADLALRNGSATVYLGLVHRIHLVGFADTPDDARFDAELLNRVGQEKLKVPLLGAKLLEPPEFRFADRKVEAEMRLLPSDLQWLLGMMTPGCW